MERGRGKGRLEVSAWQRRGGMESTENWVNSDGLEYLGASQAMLRRMDFMLMLI